MEISDFCEQVLFSPNLREKLHDPELLSDNSPRGLSIKIHRPQRTIDLRWHDKDRQGRQAFPKLSRLQETGVRGQVLHFFANHELLALELMAYQLLKFPDAPTAFRMGLAQTMRDEQKHMRLYLARMLDWSVEFGQYPISGYFWNALSEVASPLSFIAGMSLTFEQANLDFASYFALQFRRVGDESTATILDQVLNDEMRHVHHGLHWFEQWRDPDLSTLEAHRRLLQYPLNLSRAKGIDFRSDLRMKVGFSTQYIDELGLLNFSKGRLPTLFVFNPSCESEVAGSWGFSPNRSLENLRIDLQTLPMLFAARGDIICVDDQPSSEFLGKLDGMGFVIPEFIVSSISRRSPLKMASAQRKLGRLAPWGRSPVVLESLRIVARVIPSTADRASARPWDEREADRYSKNYAAELLLRMSQELEWPNASRNRLAPPSIVGRSCTTIADTRRSLIEFKQDHSCVVVKAAFGSSGRNMIRCFSAELEEAQIKWLARKIEQQGSVVVEPWLEKVCDLSARYWFGPDGRVRLHGLGQFLTDHRGQFRGMVIGAMSQGLNDELQRFVHADGRRANWMESIFRRIGGWLEKEWATLPHLGPFAIDAFVYRDCHQRGQLRLKPIVEINPRYTMGHIADRLRPRLAPTKIGLLNLIRTKDIRDDHQCNTGRLVQNYLSKHRPVLVKIGHANAIAEGALFLTDLDRAREFAVLLSVDSTLKGCCERLLEILGSRACIPSYLRETYNS